MAGLTRLKPKFCRLLSSSSSSLIALILSVLVIMIVVDLDRVTVTGKGLQISMLEKPDNLSYQENSSSSVNDGLKQILKIIGGEDHQNSPVDETAVKPDTACNRCGGFSQGECSYICGSRGFPYYYCEQCECLCHHGVHDPTNT